MLQHKEQRVLVLFDVQNMYYSGKHLYNQKVSFQAILDKAVAKRRFVRAVAYVIKTEIKEESNFHDALEKIGIEVKAKDIQIFHGGAKKGDWDIGIAMDAVRMAPKVDVIVLVSGDGDFRDLVLYLQGHGVRCESISFGETTSSRLKEVVDSFFDLSSDKKKYLLGSAKGRGMPHRGPNQGGPKPNFRSGSQQRNNTSKPRPPILRNRTGKPVPKTSVTPSGKSKQATKTPVGKPGSQLSKAPARTPARPPAKTPARSPVKTPTRAPLKRSPPPKRKPTARPKPGRAPVMSKKPKKEIIPSSDAYYIDDE